MKKFILGILAAFALASCGTNEQSVYDESKVFLTFDKNIYDLNIKQDAEGEVVLNISSSKIENFDRVYDIEIIDIYTDANPNTYTLPTTLTIPANERFGKLVVKGQDNGLVDVNIKILTFKIKGLRDVESIDQDQISINIKEFCPVIVEDFVGDYIASTWWAGDNVYYISAGAEENTFVIENFFEDDTENPNFVFKYNPDNNNIITFENRSTGYFASQYNGYIMANMDPATVSKFDGCNGRINIFVDYRIMGIGTYGTYNEIFTKL